jgi:hypothetical protein
LPHNDGHPESAAPLRPSADGGREAAGSGLKEEL